MIILKGTELVKDVQTKMTNGGKEFANIEFANGLKMSTFSSSAIGEAIMARDMQVPLAFQGVLKSREWEGKHYSDPSIESAWALTVEKLKTESESKDGLPF